MQANPIIRAGSKLLAKYLTKTVSTYQPFSVHRTASLAAIMQPGDILLVEGDQRVSSAIKYLTQSTWSHAAFYIDKMPDSIDYNPTTDNPPPQDNPTEDNNGKDNNDRNLLIEADLKNGVIAAPLSKYSKNNIRICRPLNLTDSDRDDLCLYMANSIGMQYDLKNIVDLMRYLLPHPPVPRRWRRRMLALGSGDPTRAICSTLIAKAFQSIQYPILPTRICTELQGSIKHELMHIRHHSLFAPRDFDLSPYFQIVKPELYTEFNYTTIDWHEHTDGTEVADNDSHSENSHA